MPDSVQPILFDTPDEEDQEAVHDEPDPEHGWRGADLTKDELADDDYASQFPVAQTRGSNGLE